MLDETVGVCVVIGNQVAARRGELGISPGEFARRIGISRQALHAIETGQSTPSVKVALRIAGQLGSTAEELFGAKTDEPALDFAPEPGRSYRLAVGRVKDRLVARRMEAPGGRISGGQSDALMLDGSITHGAGSGRSIFLSGCDPSLGVLADWMSKMDPSNGYRWILSQNSVAKEEVQTGLTNFGLIHSDPSRTHDWLAEGGFRSVELCTWTISMVVGAGNPKRITSLGAANSGGYRLARRPDGSGAMSLLDAELARLGTSLSTLSPTGLPEFPDHRSAAMAIKLGLADYGLVATSIALDEGLEVIESYEQKSLLIWADGSNDPVIVERIINELHSNLLSREVQALPGYAMAR